MTDFNSKQLVVKAQVEPERVHPTPDQQVAMADQPMAMPQTQGLTSACAEHYREPDASAEPVHDRAQPPTCSKCGNCQPFTCSGAAVQRLEADLAEARRLQKATAPTPVGTPVESSVAHSQAPATSITRMTLGATKPPAPPAPVMQTTLLPVETISVRVTGARVITQPAESPYSLQTVHGGCTCHQPVRYVSYVRAYPEHTGRVSRHHYQYRTYALSPLPGYHVEDLPWPAARGPGGQPEHHTIQAQHDPVGFQPISATMRQPEFVLAPSPPVPTEPPHALATATQCEATEEAAAPPAATRAVCAVYPLPKPQGRYEPRESDKQ